MNIIALNRPESTGRYLNIKRRNYAFQDVFHPSRGYLCRLYLYRRDTELAMLQRPAEIWKVLIIKAPRNLNVSTCGGNIMETHNTRLAAISPEPECGKSRVLEISEVLVPRPVESVSVTPAYLF